MVGTKYDVPRWRWLRWVMSKLRLLRTSTYVDYKDTYSIVTISSDTVLDVLRQGLWDIQKIRHERPKRIYIGHKYFDQLMKDDRLLREPITWPVKIYGCEIIATPYLEGILPVWE
jgi:hypothetical protein